MLTGLRAGDAPVIQRLCAHNHAAFLRVGRLLTARMALSEAALTALLATPAGVSALMDPALAHCADELALLALLARHQASDLPVSVAVAPHCEDGWRVLALSDEIDNPLLQTASLEIAEAPTPVIDAVGALAPHMRESVEGVLSARDGDQRAAALERLRYSGVPLAVVARLMPMLLADGAEMVRERAMALCLASGARSATVDCIRAIARGDGVALDRALSGVAAHDAEQGDVVIAAVLAQLARGGGWPGLVNALTHLAEHVARHADCERILDVVLGTTWELVPLIRALQQHAAMRVHRALSSALGRDAESDARLVALLAGVQGVAADQALLRERALDLLLSSGEKPRSRQVLAAALIRIDAECLLVLAQRAAQISGAGDTAVQWLIGERLRAGIGVPHGALLEQLVEGVQRCIAQGGLHRMACLEQQVPALLPPGAARARLAGPLLEVLAATRDERSRDLVHAALIGLRGDAIAAAWSMIDGHPAASVRLMACTVLPDVLTGDAALAAATRLLDLSSTRSDAAERAALVTAAARCAAAGDAALIEQVVHASEGLGWRGAAAWGLCAGFAACADELRESLMKRLLIIIEQEPPDREAGVIADAVDSAKGDTVWILDDAMATHSEALPAAIAASMTALASEHFPAALRNRCCDRLRRQWLHVSSFATMWGPGSTMELGIGLAQLASLPHVGTALRLRVLDALIPRLGQPHLAQAVVAAVSVPGGPMMAQCAGRVAAQMIRLVGENRFVEDEWDIVIPLLRRLAALPELGSDGETVRQRLGYCLHARTR